MNFSFEQDFQGFQKNNPEIDLNLVTKNQKKGLLCRCSQSLKNPGIYRMINLPSPGQYKLKILALANNHRTEINFLDETSKQSILKDTLFLTKKKESHELKFYASSLRIRLTVEIGGDSIATSGDYFIIHQIKLTSIGKNSLILDQSQPNNQSNNQSNNQPYTTYSSQKSNQQQENDKSLMITRQFETVEEMDRELQAPLRNNATHRYHFRSIYLRAQHLERPLYRGNKCSPSRKNLIELLADFRRKHIGLVPRFLR
jgi:hypothetical protein